MPYLSRDDLLKMGFKRLGKNVKVSDRCSVYNPDEIEIDDNSRVDDYCVLSGKINIGKYCHITPMCLIAGGEPGVYLSDFCTLAYGVKIFSQSDDYTGETMVNSLIPKKYKKEIMAPVFLGRQVIVGAESVVFPGVFLAEGCSVGAMSLVNKSTESWGVYVGNPAKRIKERKQDILKLESKFLEEVNSDDSIQ